MVAVQRRREEAVLAQMTAWFPPRTQVSRVFIMRTVQSPGRRTFLLGDGDQVDMVRQQALAEHSQAVPLGMMPQEH